MDFEMPDLPPEAHEDVIPTYKLMYMHSLRNLLIGCEDVDAIVKALKKRLVPRHGESVANEIVQAAIKFNMALAYVKNTEAQEKNPDDYSAAQKVMVLYNAHQESAPAYVQQTISKMIGRFHSTVVLGKGATEIQVLESACVPLEDSTAVLTSQYYKLRKELEPAEKKRARRSGLGKHGPTLRTIVSDELGISEHTLNDRLRKSGVK